MLQYAEQQRGRWHYGAELAGRLRAETTVTVDWIAQRLAMGTRGHLAHLLYLNGQAPHSQPVKPAEPELMTL